MSRLAQELQRVDQLAGASVHSVPAVEAAWPRGKRVSWAEAWRIARRRYIDPELRVAFLEGLLAALRTEQ